MIIDGVVDYVADMLLLPDHFGCTLGNVFCFINCHVCYLTHLIHCLPPCSASIADASRHPNPQMSTRLNLPWSMISGRDRNCPPACGYGTAQIEC